MKASRRKRHCHLRVAFFSPIQFIYPMHSLNPIVTKLVSKLTPALLEAWEERAAVMEFDANIERELAECLALLDLISNHPEALLKCWT